MNLTEIKTALDAVGIPVAYDHYETEQAMPYICFKELSTRPFAADNRVKKKIPELQVELYTKTRNLELEDKLEKALEPFVWTRELDFDDDDDYYAVFYSFEMI